MIFSPTINDNKLIKRQNLQKRKNLIMKYQKLPRTITFIVIKILKIPKKIKHLLPKKRKHNLPMDIPRVSNKNGTVKTINVFAFT